MLPGVDIGGFVVGLTLVAIVESSETPIFILWYEH